MSKIPVPNSSAFEGLNETIINDILLYLKEQGHHFEGNLERSIKLVLEEKDGKFIVGADGVDYILDLEFGVSAEDMQRKDIDEEKLKRWVKFRTSQGHVTPSVNKIIKLWDQHGFELPGAKAYSNKPIVSGAITYTFENNDRDYYNKIDDIVFNYLNDQFNEVKSGTIK